METLIRTALILLAAFFIGQAVPKDAILIPLVAMIAVAGSLVDFFLKIGTGRGLLSHFKHTTNEQE